jgi:hypothetical protein
MLWTVILSGRRVPFCTAVLALALMRSPIAASSADVILYASNVSVISGAWARTSSSSGAGGLKLTTIDAGWAALDRPLAAPANYFEARFDAPAGATYQLWLRLRAANNSKWNDSVWVQFSDAVDSTGSALWRVGTASGLLVNLEDCIGCGLESWGWQDNASWSGQSARVQFATSGSHTIRIQLREDGVDVDQIVLSPVTWFSGPPGAVTADTTIVPNSSSPVAITFVRAPYLQQVTSGSAMVVWATRQSGAGEVRYRAAGDAVRVAPAATRLVRGTVTGMAENYYQHEALLTALTASTSYAYTVSVGGVDGGGDRFTTAPQPGSGAVRFLAFGDSGVGSTPQRQLASLMTAETFDFAVHTGDVVYGAAGGIGAGGYQQLHNWFFDIYRNWLGSRPVFPSIGNHDEGANRAAPYRDVFVLPAGGASAVYPDHAERFYSFDYGPAHVVVLDTELAFQDTARRQDQLAWLADDLARTAQPWKIAVFHRSPFSAGGEHGSDLTVRAELAPIFEAYGVALVLSGHEHDYERTIPWRQTAGGTPVTYIVTGGGGAPLYPAGVAAWTAASRSAFHYVRATVTSCTISIEAVGLDAKVFDSTKLERCMPAAEPPEVLIYATDVARTFGAWRSVPDASAANGIKLVSADLGRANIEAPLVSPNDYVEATFDAPAGVAYRLWLRLRATGDTKYSESVWVQFSDALNAAGSAVHRIGTPRALLVNLEDCFGCGVAGWGWQNRAYWLADASHVRFANSGTHTIRIQIREDGVQLDQIVLSPASYLAATPGALKNDATILPKR